MAEVRDIYPTLPNVIDVGGIRYYMLPGKPIEDVYKSREDYMKTFGRDSETERILRQYMGFSLQSKKRLKFESPEDKKSLIDILKKRADQLKASEEFSSSVLKNTIFQRSYLNIQKIIDDISGTGTKNTIITPPESDKCTKNSTPVKEIPQDMLFFILLEIAWYLLNPTKVPKDIECKWAELIQDLETTHLRKIVDMTKTVSPSTNDSAKPVNYFSKMGLNIVEKEKFSNALEMIQKYIKNIDGDDANEDMKERLKILLNVLKMKKYLDDTTPINSAFGKTLSNSLITNPMRGGAGQIIDRPLGKAMLPFFDYFRVVFDPIYTFLDSALRAGTSNSSIKSVTIPQLVTLLHICNNLKPSETNEAGSYTYGVFRITNVGSDILDFFKRVLGATAAHLDSITDQKEVDQFGKQLFKLPNVRLTSLIDSDSTSPVPETIPYTRFLVLDSNFTITGDRGTLEENDRNKFFTPENLYIVCTNSTKYESIDIEIPMNLYDINFDDVDVTTTILPNITPFESIFSKKGILKPSPTSTPIDYHLEKYINLKPGVTYNATELALSIFILFKQLMPV